MTHAANGDKINIMNKNTDQSLLSDGAAQDEITLIDEVTPSFAKKLSRTITAFNDNSRKKLLQLTHPEPVIAIDSLDTSANDE